MRGIHCKLEDGRYALSGIEEFSCNEDWEDYEGIHIILNDVVYDLVCDNDDGYRSYGRLLRSDISATEIKFRFTPQLVDVRNVEIPVEEDEWHDDGYYGIAIFDAKNGKLVFEAGTDYADSYYPVAHFTYNPQNLSINEGR